MAKEEIRLTVAGVGSYFAKDDEIGLALVKALQERPQPKGVEFILWEGVDGLSLAHDLLELSHPLLIVDCADMSLLPGHRRLFDSSQAALSLKLHNISTHGFGLPEALALARGLGFDGDVFIFGIQPFDLSPRAGLSPEMTKLFPLLLDELTEHIENLSQRFAHSRSL